jgi:hypothetical protein
VGGGENRIPYLNVSDSGIFIIISRVPTPRWRCHFSFTSFKKKKKKKKVHRVFKRLFSESRVPFHRVAMVQRKKKNEYL